MELSAAKYTAFRFHGVAFATLIVVGWLAWESFALLALDPGTTSPLVTIATILVLTFLYTGLFITAHDAMHGLVAPRYPTLNHCVGQIAVFLYAAFSMRRLLVEHRRHHAAPATADDPDFHEIGRFLPWYVHFMYHYVSWSQLAVMCVLFNVFHHLCGIPTDRLLLFWAFPALLSTVQLFYFGTYLPHRRPESGYGDQHAAQTSGYPRLLSLLSCYHFGYHWEHHAYPFVPWWRLPEVVRR